MTSASIRAIKLAISFLCVVCLAWPGWVTVPVSAMPATRLKQQVALPPECVTRTSIRPVAIPSWVFVMNFNVIQAGNPLGCVMVFRLPRTPTDTIPVPCNVVGAGVTFAGGQGNFNGGHVRCPVNLKIEFAALSPTLALTQSYDYPYFTIVGVGRIAFSNIVTQTFSNPVAYYAPDNPSAPPVGLFVPLSQTVSVAVINSLFNGVANVGTSPFQVAAAGGPLQTWGAKHDGAGETYTVTHLLGDVVNQTFSPRAPVTFWVDGGTFAIGGSPLGPSFIGVLDEVIVDPPDGGPPPGLRFLPAVFGKSFE